MAYSRNALNKIQLIMSIHSNYLIVRHQFIRNGKSIEMQNRIQMKRKEIPNKQQLNQFKCAKSSEHVN